MAGDPLDSFVGAFPEEYWSEVRRLFEAHSRSALGPKAVCRAIIAECRHRAAMYDVICTSMTEAPVKAIAAAESAYSRSRQRRAQGTHPPPAEAPSDARSDAPSPAQLAYLKRLGYEGVPKTKREASMLIDTLAPPKEAREKKPGRSTSPPPMSQGDPKLTMDPGPDESEEPFLP